MTAVCRDTASSMSTASPRPTWTWTRFEALSVRDLYDLLALRNQVFVVEQTCVFPDTDYCDQSAWHLLGRDADGQLVAYLRGIDAGIKYREPSLGRVVTAERVRGHGLGRALMEEGIRRGRALWPRRDIVIGAQQRLAAFYTSLGFIVEGETYLEDGIDHIRMRLPAQ